MGLCCPAWASTAQLYAACMLAYSHSRLIFSIRDACFDVIGAAGGSAPRRCAAPGAVRARVAASSTRRRDMQTAGVLSILYAELASKHR